MKIFLLEDDKILAKEIKSFLEQKGFECLIAFDGEELLNKISTDSGDIILLDINVPRTNGIDVCKLIRDQNKETPIMMLTALADLDNKLKSFKYGADDYLVKPFHLEEMYIRIISLIRRSNFDSKEIISLSDLDINIGNKSVKRAGKEITLTNKEFTLLLILAEAKGKILSKKEIAHKLWDDHFETSYNTIEVYINFLRGKVDKGFEKKLIQTKIGFGYYLKEE